MGQGLKLARAPVQARGLETVRRAIDVAIELLDEQGDAPLHLLDVTARSGVSNGSLMHHFGTRDGLVAAALATRFDRAAVERVRLFNDLSSSPERIGPALAAMLLATGKAERAAARRARFRALAFARHRPELRAALIESFHTVEQELALRIAVGQAAGIVVDGLSSSALAVFSDSYAVGRLIEGTLLDPLPEEEWEALFLAVLGAIVPQSVIDSTRSAGVVVREPLPPARCIRPTIPTLALPDAERAVIDHAIEHLGAQSEDSLLVRTVCVATGVTRAWFSRHLGGREELLDLARLDLLIAGSCAEAALYEQAFDEAMSVEQLHATLARVVRRSDSPSFRASAWARLDLLIAAPGRGRLTEDAGTVVRAALARTTDAIAGAQQRGIVRADVTARAVARFLWGYPLAFLLGDLAEVSGPDLHELAERTLATLTPDGTR